ncbi:flp pilus-assembly TadE/G-like family protein [Corynebacterium sp. MSK041]|uniref:Rv3654c family TadE-like protein n=1 Tax=Corynebacterium sp. MSK041 TaxID=3050194 RepID=UPI002550F02A|nr:Rv3654c family TadE-like protein [Corynebacterium sp. MSK041]MDK8795518.1 flp pilus-assembly TadE/G-like family protein [Corynebacterium sp. MSK041]
MKHKLLIGDHGYATILSASIVAAVVSLAVVVAGIVSQVVNSHRAQVAADLSAVTAATALYAGHDPCGKATLTAELNKAHVLSCQVIESDTVLTVKVGRVEATARAGPI